MTRKIVKTGSSLAVTLPHDVVREFQLKAGDEVDVSVHPQTGAIIVRTGVQVPRGRQSHEAFQGGGGRLAPAAGQALSRAREVTP